MVCCHLCEPTTFMNQITEELNKSTFYITKSQYYWIVFSDSWIKVLRNVWRNLRKENCWPVLWQQTQPPSFNLWTKESSKLEKTLYHSKNEADDHSSNQQKSQKASEMVKKMSILALFFTWLKKIGMKCMKATSGTVFVRRSRCTRGTTSS